MACQVQWQESETCFLHEQHQEVTDRHLALVWFGGIDAKIVSSECYAEATELVMQPESASSSQRTERSEVLHMSRVHFGRTSTCNFDGVSMARAPMW